MSKRLKFDNKATLEFNFYPPISSMEMIIPRPSQRIEIISSSATHRIEIKVSLLTYRIEIIISLAPTELKLYLHFQTLPTELLFRPFSIKMHIMLKKWFIYLMFFFYGDPSHHQNLIQKLPSAFCKLSIKHNKTVLMTRVKPAVTDIHQFRFYVVID